MNESDFDRLAGAAEYLDSLFEKTEQSTKSPMCPIHPESRLWVTGCSVCNLKKDNELRAQRRARYTNRNRGKK